MAKETTLLPTKEQKMAPLTKEQTNTTKMKEALLGRIPKSRLTMFFTLGALATTAFPPSCKLLSWANFIPNPYYQPTLWAAHSCLTFELPKAIWIIADLLSAEDRIPVFSTTRYTLPSAIARILLVVLSMTSCLVAYTFLNHYSLHYKLQQASELAWCALVVVFLPRGRWLHVIGNLVGITAAVFFGSLYLKMGYDRSCRPFRFELLWYKECECE